MAKLVQVAFKLRDGNGGLSRSQVRLKTCQRLEPQLGNLPEQLIVSHLVTLSALLIDDESQIHTLESANLLHTDVALLSL